MTGPQFSKRSCRAREHVTVAGQLYPEAWRRVEELRQERGSGVPGWPDWCFLPIAATLAIVATDAGLPVESLHLVYPERIHDAARLAGLAAWRVTQGVYRFDPAVYEALCDTPVTGDIPHEVLFRLPEWCVYIEMPEMTLGSDPMVGAFAHLEHDVNTGQAELRLLLDIDASAGPMLMPLVLHLGAWSLAESIGRALALAEANAGRHGEPVALVSGEPALRGLLSPLISLLLYLCSQAGEIGDGTRRPANPAPKRTKRGWRLFAADKPTTWDVGVRLGAALRRAFQGERTGQEGTHAGPRAHIRRAHWHGFWSGPRDGERRFDMRWMPPIAVNVDDVGNLPATVRPVK